MFVRRAAPGQNTSGLSTRRTSKVQMEVVWRPLGGPNRTQKPNKRASKCVRVYSTSTPNSNELLFSSSTISGLDGGRHGRRCDLSWPHVFVRLLFGGSIRLVGWLWLPAPHGRCRGGCHQGPGVHLSGFAENLRLLGRQVRPNLPQNLIESSKVISSSGGLAWPDLRRRQPNIRRVER